MSIENISKYIQEVSAIKNYPDLERQRDELLAQLKSLQTRVDGLVSQSEQEKKRADDLQELVSTLELALEERGEESEEARNQVNVLQLRIGELESLKATTDGKTLEQAKQAFLESQEEEITKVATQLSNGMKDEWMKKEMPAVKETESIKLLVDIINALQKHGLQALPEEIQNSGLPSKIEGMVSDEAKGRVNDEFRRKVKETANRLASVELERLVKVAWPKFLVEKVDPKARQLEESIKTNVVTLLNQVWTVSCDKCGTGNSVKFIADGIEDLLRRGYAVCECQEETCRDWSGQHKIKVTLQMLLKELLSA